MKSIISIVLALTCLVAAKHAEAFSPQDSQRILVVYNEAITLDTDHNGVQDALQMANYYKDFRKIPDNHLLAVDTGTGYFYAEHDTFYNELVVPIRNKLEEIGPTNIDVILLIYGIPYRTEGRYGTVCVDNCLMGINNISDQTSLSSCRNPYLEKTPTINTDLSHFNHELYSYNGHMYIVCRLSTPDVPWGVINQLDQIQYAETFQSPRQSNGTIYVDTRYQDYTDEQLPTDLYIRHGVYSTTMSVDMNIAQTKHYVDAKNLPLGRERTGSVIGGAGASISEAHNALLYAGWYNLDNYNDAFDWLPGSIGCDLNSDSASGMRTGRGWVGGAFNQGLSCGVGVIDEPYASGHQRPNILIYYLINGFTFAEASMLSTPRLFWQSVNLGDPLYAPYSPRTFLQDTTAPVLCEGYPQTKSMGQDYAILSFEIEKPIPHPEVVQCVVHYGTTPDCQQAYTGLKGWWRHKDVILPNLESGTQYYYKLVLTDPAGNTTTSPVSTFETLNSPAVAQFEVSATAGHTPFDVYFNAESSFDTDGHIVSWEWDFGDGHNGSGSSIHHTYNESGFIRAYLTLTDDDGATSIKTCLLKIEPENGAIITLQQGSDGYSNAEDSYITSYYTEDPNSNYGNSDLADVFSDLRRALLRFGIQDIPANAKIISAKLHLYIFSKAWGSDDSLLGAFRITQDWVEGSGEPTEAGVTWLDYDRGFPWTTPGGDYNEYPEDTVAYRDINSFDWIDFDITDIVQAWLSGDYDNFGLMIAPLHPMEIFFRTKEWEIESERPMLSIMYEIQPDSTIQVETTEHGTVLPDNTITVPYGNSAEFTIQAAPYYHIASIMMNGEHIASSPFDAHIVQTHSLIWPDVIEDGTLSVRFEPDTTQNNIPHWWFAEYGWTSDFETHSLEDSDGDGFYNLEEYQAATDPTDETSYPIIIENLAIQQESSISAGSGGYWNLMMDGISSGYNGSSGFGYCQVGDAMIMDLKQICLIYESDILFWDGDARTYGYSLEASLDGRVWEDMVAPTIGASVQENDFTPPVRARYIKIKALSNTANREFHIVEWEVWGTVDPDQSIVDDPSDPGINLAIEQQASITSGSGARWSLMIDGISSGYNGSSGFGYCQVGDAMIMDLKQICLVNESDILFWDGDARSYGYSLEASLDGRVWEDMVAPTIGASLQAYEFTPPVRARYIKIKALSNTANREFHIVEWEVWGMVDPDQSIVDDPSDPGINLAIEQQASITSGSGARWSLIVDGISSGYNGSSGFGYCQIGDAIIMDLKQICPIDEMNILLWDGDARTYGYRLETSMDGIHWDLIVPATTGSSWQTIVFEEEITAQYVRLHALSNTANNEFHVVEWEIIDYTD